jgi:hypothetical protein
MLEFLFDCLMATISGVLWLAFSAFMVWMIVECATKEPREGHERLIWIIITVFVPYLGALAYYLIRRPERIRAAYDSGLGPQG